MSRYRRHLSNRRRQRRAERQKAIKAARATQEATETKIGAIRQSYFGTEEPNMPPTYETPAITERITEPITEPFQPLDYRGDDRFVAITAIIISVILALIVGVVIAAIF